MKKHLGIAGLALAVAVAPAMAQATGPCPQGGSPATVSGAQANVIRDACLQAVDVFQLVAPQLGLALSGGNATLGQGGALGGLGHFAVGVRANVFRGDLPQVTRFPAPRNEENPPGQVLPSTKTFEGLPVIDAAIGLFKGFPIGLTNVGGVDLLLNAMYVPTIGQAGDNVQIKPNSNLKVGFGGRLGLVQESLLTPGIGVTFIHRDLPSTDIIGNSSNTTITITNTDVTTSAWRIVANKNFIVFGLALGAGQDRYDQSATVSGAVKGFTVGGISIGDQQLPQFVFDQKLTRTNVFGDLSFNIAILKLVLEAGQVTGGSVRTTNTFSSGQPDDARLYGSVGLRFGF